MQAIYSAEHRQRYWLSQEMMYQQLRDTVGGYSLRLQKVDNLGNKNEVTNIILHNEALSADSSTMSYQVITMDQSDNIKAGTVRSF